MAKVSQKAGRTYLVKKGTPNRPVSIRNLPHWQLGIVEAGALFHALWREGEWVWGHVVAHGHTLTYADHHRCGWIMRRNLRKPRTPVKFVPPPLSYKRWQKESFKSIVKLYLDLVETKQPVSAQKRHHMAIKGYHNCGPSGSPVGSGGELDVQWPVAIRYLNDRGWYMARRSDLKHGDPKDPGWFFIHGSFLIDPRSEVAGDRLNSARAEARFNKQFKKRKRELLRIHARHD